LPLCLLEKGEKGAFGGKERREENSPSLHRVGKNGGGFFALENGYRRRQKGESYHLEAVKKPPQSRGEKDLVLQIKGGGSPSVFLGVKKKHFGERRKRPCWERRKSSYIVLLKKGEVFPFYEKEKKKKEIFGLPHEKKNARKLFQPKRVFLEGKARGRRRARSGLSFLLQGGEKKRAAWVCQSVERRPLSLTLRPKKRGGATLSIFSKEEKDDSTDAGSRKKTRPCRPLDIKRRHMFHAPSWGRKQERDVPSRHLQKGRGRRSRSTFFLGEGERRKEKRNGRKSTMMTADRRKKKEKLPSIQAELQKFKKRKIEYYSKIDRKKKEG